ncbi:MAG: FecR domain-containing protein [Bacillota bacterium]|nr:FecR domain-containing protein [Bacillota bacterium]
MMFKRRTLLIITVLLFVMAISSFAAEKRTAKVVEFHGKVQVQRSASEKKISVFKNMVIEEGDKIITGKDSKIVLTVDQDKEVTLAANTIAVLSELKGNDRSNDTVITIQAGGVGSKIDKKLDKNSNYRIKTPTAVMGVRGTQFYVQVEKEKRNQENPEVNIWLTKGAIEVEYRQVGTNISPYAENKGELKSFVMSGAKKYEFPSEGKVNPSTEKFEMKGLYKEFLDYEDLSDLFTEKEVDDARKEAEKDDDDDEDEPEEEHSNPYYEEIHDDVDDEEDDDDNQAFVVPPKPTGNFVFIGKYEIEYHYPIEGELNRWVPYQLVGTQGRVHMDQVLGDPNVPSTAIFYFEESDAEANDFIFMDIEVDA